MALHAVAIPEPIDVDRSVLVRALKSQAIALAPAVSRNIYVGVVDDVVRVAWHASGLTPDESYLQALSWALEPGSELVTFASDSSSLYAGDPPDRFAARRYWRRGPPVPFAEIFPEYTGDPVSTIGDLNERPTLVLDRQADPDEWYCRDDVTLDLLTSTDGDLDDVREWLRKAGFEMSFPAELAGYKRQLRERNGTWYQEQEYAAEMVQRYLYQRYGPDCSIVQREPVKKAVAGAYLGDDDLANPIYLEQWITAYERIAETLPRGPIYIDGRAIAA